MPSEALWPAEGGDGLPLTRWEGARRAARRQLQHHSPELGPGASASAPGTFHKVLLSRDHGCHNPALKGVVVSARGAAHLDGNCPASGSRGPACPEKWTLGRPSCTPCLWPVEACPRPKVTRLVSGPLDEGSGQEHSFIHLPSPDPPQTWGRCPAIQERPPWATGAGTTA